ncbi:MAG: hypothetical protein H6970_13375 [Gammaproteobacteria bacterium]|nr:hypothetical protein [Gammaproteobacteria bacterium]
MELEQRFGLLGGKIKVSVNNDDVLIITHKTFMNSNTNRYLLDSIDPRYESIRHFSVAAGASAVVYLALSVFFGWYGKTYYEPPDDGGWLFFSLITFVAFLIAAVKAYRSRINVVRFRSIDGNWLFSILANKPSAGDVENFCERLENRIERIRYRGAISNERMANNLRRHVEFLFAQKVLSETEARLALTRISNKFKLRVLNFTRDETV